MIELYQVVGWIRWLWHAQIKRLRRETEEVALQANQEVVLWVAEQEETCWPELPGQSVRRAVGWDLGILRYFTDYTSGFCCTLTLTLSLSPVHYSSMFCARSMPTFRRWPSAPSPRGIIKTWQWRQCERHHRPHLPKAVLRLDSGIPVGPSALDVAVVCLLGRNPVSFHYRHVRHT